MKYYYSSPGDCLNVLKEMNIKKLLISFACDAKRLIKEVDENYDILIDSGAFSVWNSGKIVDIDEYLNFIKKIPKKWNCISLDIISDSHSKKERQKCAELGFENYLYLSKYKKNIIPTYHSGEDLTILKRYLDYTDYISIAFHTDKEVGGTAIDFFNTVFAITENKIKVHGLGNTRIDYLLRYPFYSVDSITYKKVKVMTGGYWGLGTKLKALIYNNIREWEYLERQLTNLWKIRGVEWQ